MSGVPFAVIKGSISSLSLSPYPLFSFIQQFRLGYAVQIAIKSSMQRMNSSASYIIETLGSTKKTDLSDLLKFTAL